MFFPPITNTGSFTADIANAINAALAASFPGQPSQLLAVGQAINPAINGFYLITDSAGAAAFTLAAPTINGTVIVLMSTTAEAHTLTATGLLATGTASVNEATFAAHAGAMVALYGYNAIWYVVASVGITFS
jgi:hypothetical protein